MDPDLSSIQEARDTVVRAYEAWKAWSRVSQADVDRVCAAMAEAGYQASERVGRLAQEETGYGVAAHKKLKNEFGSRVVWQSIRDQKTVGVIRHDPDRRLYEIAWPMGVIAALVPSTNPTSTAFFKALIAVKARNAIIFSPHPSAKRCIYEAVQAMALAAENAGAPKGLINCLQQVSLPGTQELMSHKYTALILATGGTAMVKAAHSAGKPAYGVGPGNVPVYVDRSADIEKAARYIVASKAFDYSTICATEQSVIADRPVASRLAELMRAEGAYFTNPQETDALRRALFHPDGSMNTAVVGKSASYVAVYAGFHVPLETRVLVAPLLKVGRAEPLSHEKLTTVLGWYEVDGWEQGCETSIALIQAGGRGHTQIIHANDERVIMAFGLEKPVFRILVNSMGTLGAIGFTTGLMPSMTLGSGGVGGSITGDNITAYHLINIKRLAYETLSPPPEAFSAGEIPAGPAPEEIERVVQQVIHDLLESKTSY
ncbi:acetaldehyde dehydrogenase [Longilinea arvoryzae]|uniref:Acetaldehyde dehydrogenase n=1 Tax=Longilinea arvoryzae TaxID=360412 RepID=A0A0S7BDB1_9CHLR|nr:aldehyde dehydrogenase family protein [Longilinea arvoryzae]GAP15742.1 acetaldehyde dehydrogenase [Longilinea arvoryzae]